MFADHSLLLRRLCQRLDGQLPGPPAQVTMSPRSRIGWQPGVLPDGCRHAAALVLIYPIEGRSHLLLTRRRHNLAEHGGQVSLPGGEVDAEESNVQAALRETEEEVGVSRKHVEVVGKLTPLHIPVSRFILHPIVGHAGQRPAVTPSENEVARVIEPSLASLASPSNWSHRRSEGPGAPSEVPFFAVDDLEVWGATAMVLAELLTLLNVTVDPWRADADRFVG
jgi:8-oxo-dGTP pyrophosphatase MutT (NUDIX family)